VSVDGLAVSLPRLRARLDALAEIGPIEGGGNARLALTDDDRSGRDLVVGWMTDLGLRVDIDEVGNVVGTWPPERTDAPVMTGSHIDTVATGGRFDGTLGVLAGIEVIETVIAAGVELERPLAVAFFTDEEGSRFAPDMLGSLVYAGGMALEDALSIRAIDGAILGEELLRIGYAGPQPCPARPPHAYVELHIEQGPVLEAEGTGIGVVTGVQGISWTELTVTGQSNHAGTTPMSMRHDAGYAAAAIAAFVRALAAEMGPPQVATVGRIELQPNLVNVVAKAATLTVDLRNTDDDSLAQSERRLAGFCTELAEREGVAISSRSLARFAPVEFDAAVVDLVEEIAREHGNSTMRMPSGAGHDAQMLARVCPAGMVFVPSVRGISHNPAEFTADADLEAGANVLLHVLLRLAAGEQ
jgi:beta-ureidopropionase / N-carbamoyl-L-amino-acid hydrolase